MEQLTAREAQQVKQRLNEICAQVDPEAGGEPWVEYLRDEVGLELLGVGSERAAFLLPVEGREPRVLKVPTEPGQTTQQYFEFECHAAFPDSFVLPVLWDWGPDEEYVCWLEVEYLRDVTPEEASARLLTDFGAFTLFLWHWDGRGSLWKSMGRRGYRAPIDEVGRVIRKCELDPHELIHPEHWGLDAKGRLKMRDLGLRSENPDAIKRRLMAW